jgi:streptogramin lyase
VWVAAQAGRGLSEDSLLRIDPSTNELVAAIAMPQPLDQIIAGPEAVWVSGFDPRVGGVIYRINPATGEVSDVIEDAGAPMALGDGVLWASRHDAKAEESSLLRLAAATGRVEAVVPLPITFPSFDVEVGEGSVWVRSSEQLIEVDPTIAAVVSAHDLPGFTQMAVGGGNVWIGGSAHGEVIFRLDTRTDAFLEPVRVESFGPVGYEDGAVWFLRSHPRPLSICRLDSNSLEVDACVPSGDWAHPTAAAVDIDTETIWVANYKDQVTRIDLR